MWSDRFGRVALTGIACGSMRRSRELVTIAIAVAVAVGVGACGGDDGYVTSPGGGGDGGGNPVSAATVQATPALQFTPGTVHLSVGGTVTFAFGAVPHNLFFDNAPPGAPANITAPTTDQSITRTFATAGQYRFNCHIHPGMSGTVIVQ